MWKVRWQIGVWFILQLLIQTLLNRWRLVELSLSALASACGLTTLKNTEELKGINFTAMVKINDNGYPEIDSQYGKGFGSASQGESILPKKDLAEPKPVEVDPLDSEEIPF